MENNDERFFTYDAMGNILTQERHNRQGNQFDNLKYRYQRDATGNLERNRLYHVNDAISASFDSTDLLYLFKKVKTIKNG